MENNPLLNADADYIDQLPDEIYHLSELIGVLSNRKQLNLTSIALNELILVYLKQPNCDDNILKDALLLHFLITVSENTQATSVHDVAMPLGKL